MSGLLTLHDGRHEVDEMRCAPLLTDATTAAVVAAANLNVGRTPHRFSRLFCDQGQQLETCNCLLKAGQARCGMAEGEMAGYALLSDVCRVAGEREAINALLATSTHSAPRLSAASPTSFDRASEHRQVYPYPIHCATTSNHAPETLVPSGFGKGALVRL